MPTSREFYEVHFLGNFEDWKEHTLDLRRGMNLAVSANQLADWVLEDRRSLEPNRWKRPADFRIWLATDRCPDFRVIWDLADTHKHQLISRGAVTAMEVDGAFDPAAFDPVAFDTPH